MRTDEDVEQRAQEVYEFAQNVHHQVQQERQARQQTSQRARVDGGSNTTSTRGSKLESEEVRVDGGSNTTPTRLPTLETEELSIDGGRKYPPQIDKALLTQPVDPIPPDRTKNVDLDKSTSTSSSEETHNTTEESIEHPTIPPYSALRALIRPQTPAAGVSPLARQLWYPTPIAEPPGQDYWVKRKQVLRQDGKMKQTVEVKTPDRKHTMRMERIFDPAKDSNVTMSSGRPAMPLPEKATEAPPIPQRKTLSRIIEPVPAKAASSLENNPPRSTRSSLNTSSLQHDEQSVSSCTLEENSSLVSHCGANCK